MSLRLLCEEWTVVWISWPVLVADLTQYAFIPCSRKARGLSKDLRVVLVFPLHVEAVAGNEATHLRSNKCDICRSSSGSECLKVGVLGFPSLLQCWGRHVFIGCNCKLDGAWVPESLPGEDTPSR